MSHCRTEALGLGKRGDVSAVFNDPFLLYSSQQMPTTLSSALDLSLFLGSLVPGLINATCRTFAHFITDFDYSGGSDTEQKNWDDYLHFQAMVPLFMNEIAIDDAHYGNTFIRIHYPFDRFLVHPETGAEWSLDLFRDSKFVLSRMAYLAPVRPGDSKSPKVLWKFRDKHSMDLTRLRLVRLNPRYISLEHSVMSRTTRVIYQFEPTMVQDVKNGIRHVVDDMPMAMLQAIAGGHDFRFKPDAIFHFRAPTVTGISNQGWGLPRPIAHFRSIHQLQVYRKIDEALGLDFMLPFRIFTPLTGTDGVSIIKNFEMDIWQAELAELIANRRKDPFAIHALPFPAQLLEQGASGKELTPMENMQFHYENLLDGAGFPVELWKGSLQYMQVPTAMRLFESNFNHVHLGLNSFVQWFSTNVQNYAQLPRIKTTLQRPTLADSMERRSLLFQLGSTGEISRETAYDGLGIDDIGGEIRKRLQEDAERERQTAKMQQDLQREIETGSLQPQEEQPTVMGGGTPPGQQSGQAVTPLDAQDKAQSLAEYWLSIPSDGERRNAMQAVSSQDPQLYALAKELMERMRKGGESQGRAAVNQQFQGGGAGAPPTGAPQ